MGKSEKRRRTKLVAVRFTPAERACVVDAASQLKIGVGQLIRNAIAEALPEFDEVDS